MEEEKIKVEQGKRLKNCLKYRNKTQKQLARDTYTSCVTISNIITGKAKLTNEKAVMFSHALNVRAEYLLMEDDYMTEEERFARPIANDILTRKNNRDAFKLLMNGMGLELKHPEIENENKDVSEEEFDKLSEDEKNALFGDIWNSNVYYNIYDLSGQKVGEINEFDLRSIIREIAEFAEFKMRKYAPPFLPKSK